MKKILTILTFLLVIVVIGGVGYKAYLQSQSKTPYSETITTITNSGDQQGILTDGNKPTIENVYTCNNQQIKSSVYNPEKIKTTHLLPSGCLGPDGKAYDEGTEMTFYELTFASSDIPNPDCQSVIKTCTNGTFVGEDPDETFHHLNCRVVDPEDDTIQLCEANGVNYLPGEIIYAYNTAYAALDQTCDQAMITCTDNGERFAIDGTYNNPTCQFIRALTTDYLNTYPDEIPMGPTNFACLADSGSSCETPRGTTVNHGQSVLSFAESNTGFDGICQAKSSTCNNGAWINDSDPYAYPSCLRTLPDNCIVNGKVISHGSEVTLYTQAQDDACEQQTRFCYDGELDGDDDYIYEECNATPTVNNVIVPEQIDDELREPNCPSPWGGASWRPDQEGTAYPASEVPFGSSCTAIPIVCKYGSIRRGSAANPGDPIGGLSADCQVIDPVSCTHPCGDIAHGANLTTYSQENLQHGAGETCTRIATTSECINGNLQPTPAEYCSCEISEPLGCVGPGNIPVDHGTELTMFKNDRVIVQPGETQASCEFEWKQCLNGNWYDNNGTKGPFTYTHRSCSVDVQSSNN